MKRYEQLLLNNKAWAEEKKGPDPDFFTNLAQGQQPEYLWIGCSDSRVPVSSVTQTEPGEIFVHRNIANLVVQSDINVLSVLQYAVEVLKVPYIVVCGHYGCGGIKAAMSNKSMGLIDNWLKNIKDVREKYQETLDEIDDEEAKSDKMVELNVWEQLKNIGETSIVQNAWEKGEGPVLLGWVYSLETGFINHLTEITSADEISDSYRF